jgi:putative hydrolase of the HAD superfamily
LQPDQVLHVGDDVNADVLGALKAGMQAVWVNREGHDWTADVAQPLTVRTLLELCDHLQT